MKVTRNVRLGSRTGGIGTIRFDSEALVAHKQLQQPVPVAKALLGK
jgi:hypothetical protein